MLTARTEVTDRMLIFGQRHLRLVLAPVRGPLQRTPPLPQPPSPPAPDHPVADLTQKQVKRRPVLGGAINEYEPAA
jgi:putative transposase